MPYRATVRAKWHFVRERVQIGHIKLQDVRTESIVTDMLTKSIGPAILTVNMKLIGFNVKSG